MEKKRKLYLDIFRGFLIVLVIAGHVIQQALPRSFDGNHVFRYIYSFHMPAFMFVSGFCCARATYGISFLKDRAARLLIPFFTWFLISELIRGEYGHLLENTGRFLLHPDTGLWFLWALFFCTALLVLCTDISARSGLAPMGVLFAAAVLLYAVLVFFPIKYLGVQFISYYFMFFVLGICMRKMEDHFLHPGRWITLVLLAAYFAAAFFWTRKGAIPVCGRDLVGVQAYFYRWIAALVGIAAWMRVFHLLDAFFERRKDTLPVRFMETVGKNTLGIYASHGPLILLLLALTRGLEEAVAVRLALVTVVVLAISLGMVLLFRYNRWSALLLLGERAPAPCREGN